MGGGERRERRERGSKPLPQLKSVILPDSLQQGSRDCGLEPGLGQAAAFCTLLWPTVCQVLPLGI